VVLAAGTALWLGHRFVTTSDRYAITAIEIRGAERVAAAELRAALPVAVGDNVFTASPTAVAEAARAHPWIAAAEAHRELPDTMVVEVREHRAAALAHLGDLYVIGSDGHPFKRARIEDGDGEGVPVITGLERAAYQRDPAAAARTLTAALAVLARWRAAPTRPAIGELHVGTQGTIALRTHDHGAAIELGPLGAPDAELAARLHTFDAAWAELTAEERARARVLHLDARLDQVTIAFAKD
jgi:cell division septal protein FtsQ